MGPGCRLCTDDVAVVCRELRSQLQDTTTHLDTAKKEAADARRERAAAQEEAARASHVANEAAQRAAGQAAQDRAAQPPAEAAQPHITIVQEVLEEEEQHGPLDAPMQVPTYDLTYPKISMTYKNFIRGLYRSRASKYNAFGAPARIMTFPQAYFKLLTVYTLYCLCTPLLRSDDMCQEVQHVRVFCTQGYDVNEPDNRRQARHGNVWQLSTQNDVDELMPESHIPG